MPAHAVVAEPREEVQHGVVRRQLAALGEAADGEDVAVGRSHVLLVRTVLSHAGDEGLDRDDGLVIGNDIVVFERRLFLGSECDLKIEYTQLNRLTTRGTRSPRGE